MNSASQTDTPEWSKFAPLRSRLRSNSEGPLTVENLAAVDPSSQSATPIAPLPAAPAAPGVVAVPVPPFDELADPLVAFSTTAHPAEQFVCHNRRCQDRRERHGKAPRPLFSAHWRRMKIGRRHTLVLDLAVRCPDCNFEHRATLFPPEWLDAPK